MIFALLKNDMNISLNTNGDASISRNQKNTLFFKIIINTEYILKHAD